MRRALLIAAITGALLVIVALWPARAPAFDTVRAAYVPSDAWLLDRDGALLDTRRLDFNVRRAPWVALSAVSPNLINAVLEGEDRRFWLHHGIDWRSILGALRDRLWQHRARGASTITMQVATLLEAPHARRGARAWWAKWQQMRLARGLEARWSKAEILEAYLNLLRYRGELQGVGAAAAALVHGSPAAISPSEAEVLAALLPSPNAAVGTVAARACARARALRSDEACEAIRAAAERVLGTPADEPAAAHAAPELAAALLHAPGQRQPTTIDPRVQQLAATTLRARLLELADHNVRDGAVLVVDNDSGEVLAYVGSGGPASRSAQVDGVRALRQAGSTLKPFLYQLALEHRYLTAASLLEDSPVALDTPSGTYIPQDYDHDFKGLVSVRTALAGSLNVPAVRTLGFVGVEVLRERLVALGYRSIRREGQYYGFALALGSPEVSLWEQVQAYRTLERGGRAEPIRVVPEPGESGVAPSVDRASAAFIVDDILSDRAARAVTFGLDNALVTPFWSAVKTGTSDNMRDNWCLGFSRHYTVGVWVGNFEGDSMLNVSGVSGAAGIWHDLLVALERDSPAPGAPASLIARDVHFVPAVEPPRREWFLPEGGTAPPDTDAALTQGLPSGAAARIRTPANGLMIAMDPDIPPAHQRVLITAEGAEERMHLSLNGQDLGSARRPHLWAPLPGHYELRLLGPAGATLDRVRFTVRAGSGA